MPIKKRLSPEEALKKRLPKGWKACMRYDLMQQLCREGRFNPTPKNVDKAIKLTKSWKGASWIEKVFVHLLDILLEKSGREGVLTAEQYTRLQDHLTTNLDKIFVADWQTWHLWLWDVYHDPRGLIDLEPGELHLPSPVRSKRVKPLPAPKPPKPKRHKLRKHK